MSVQLIVYPQTYEGEYNSISVSFPEIFVDGINFNNVNGSSITQFTPSVTLVQDVIDNFNPTMVTNTWYRYSDSSSTSFPKMLNSQLQLVIGGALQQGIIQKMTGLVVGASYTIEINLDTGVKELPTFYLFEGTTLKQSQSFGSITTTSIATFTFIPSTTHATILIDLKSSTVGVSAALINSISVTTTAITPTGIQTILSDGQAICDLYENEDIPLSLSVDDFKNVAEKVQSYSKAFKLPATKRNNLIFDNMFDITRNNDGVIFNPYNKTECVLKQDGFILFKGYLKMIDITDKNGEISYNVNLYSEVVALADVLKDRTFNELEFTELKHTYNYTQIKNSWTGDLGLINPLPTGTYAGTAGTSTTGVLKYPFVNWNNQYTHNSDGLVLSNLESSFRPFIQLKYLINRIFEPTPFTWESSFFDSPTFNNLYMDFNWGSDNNPNDLSITGMGDYKTGDADNFATTAWSNVVLTNHDFTTEFGFNNSTNVFTCPAGQDNSTFNLSCTVNTRNVLNNADLEYRWLKNGTTVINPSSTYSTTGMAAATVTINPNGFPLGNIFGGGVQFIDITDGGNYASAPTVTMSTSGTFPGSGFAGTAVMTGTAVTSVTIVTSGTSYNENDRLLFNGVPVSQSLTTYTSAVVEPLDPGDTLALQFKASANSCIKQDNVYGTVRGTLVGNLSTGTIIRNNQPATTCQIHGSVGVLSTTTSTLLQALRGEIGQWEFLKGIMTMFNLISLPDESNPNNIIFEPYADVFHTHTSSGDTSDLTLASRSIQHDWTDKIDVAEMKLTPLTDLNKKTIFKFVEDDDDYTFNVYKVSVGEHLYGSQVFNSSTASNGLATVLQGTKEIVAEPFAATIIKPTNFFYPDFITPSIYAYNADDGVSEGFDNAPRILYDNGVKSLTSSTYKVPTQSGVAGDNTENEFLQFTHLSSIPTTLFTEDFHFGACQLIDPIGDSVPNNLYGVYWSPYYNELYNPDTRIMTIKVNLNASDINRFKFTDTVMIKNREFRVNKIDYKPNDLATVEFILIP